MNNDCGGLKIYMNLTNEHPDISLWSSLLAGLCGFAIAASLLGVIALLHYLVHPILSAIAIIAGFLMVLSIVYDASTRHPTDFLTRCVRTTAIWYVIGCAMCFVAANNPSFQ